MKKILIFSLAYYPNNVSGAEAAIKEITDRISPQDIEFHMVTLRYNSKLPTEEQFANVYVHRIGLVKPDPKFEDLGKIPLDFNKPIYQFLSPIKGLMLNRKHKFDAIWSMMAHSAGVPAVIFKKFSPKTKYILTLQEGDPTDYIEKKMKPVRGLFQKAFSQADYVQAISKHLADWARSQGVKEEKIKIIHNGANPRDLNPISNETELIELKKKYNKQPDDIFLVNTARLVHQKGTENTLRAMIDLPDNIKFLLVGDGPEEKMLKNLAKELKIEDRVIFVGRVDRNEVSKYRQISDIFVCPSRSEGLGNAFLSAMASRLPIIATQEGGLIEFISDQTAWVVAKDKPEQISLAVKDILANPEKVKTITTNAYNMVSKEYNWDLVTKNMKQQIFDKLI